MYSLESYINGKNVKVVNHNFFHGILANSNGTIGPRRPFSKVQPLHCVYNTFDCPRVTFLSIDMILSESLASLIPSNEYVELIEVVVDKYICRDYFEDFGFIYSDRKYVRNHDKYVNDIVRNSPQSDIDQKEKVFEVLAYWCDKVSQDSKTQIRYSATEGHQSSDLEKTILLPEGLIDKCGVLHSNLGYLLRDDIFQALRPYLRGDFFHWQKLVPE
jgi:hypothetical protein